MTDHQQHDEACDLAHGIGSVERDWRLVVLSASPVGLWLLHFARDVGYHTTLVEPDADQVSDQHRRHADLVVTSVEDAEIDGTCDVVATDHDTEHLVDLLEVALRTEARWVGLMGSVRHDPPHVGPLRDRGLSDDEIARVHRPIGLPIGSRTPPEIAIATVAGLIADRNDHEFERVG